MIKEWPNSIYDVDAVIVAVQSELGRTTPSGDESRVLMECLAELSVLYYIYALCVLTIIQLPIKSATRKGPTICSPFKMAQRI